MIDSAGFVGVRQIIDILTVEPIFDMLVDQEKNNERGKMCIRDRYEEK